MTNRFKEILPPHTKEKKSYPQLISLGIMLLGILIIDIMVAWSIVWMILILVISVAVVIYYIMRYDHFFPND